VTGGFDPATPNVARVYNGLLGGKDPFPADRAEAGRLLEIYPPLRDLVHENRAFLHRAVIWAVRQGIGQFIDLGSGLPAPFNIHQSAKEADPAARVVYVDTDPMALVHARALLADGDTVAAIGVDLADPAAVLADPELRAVINPAGPVAVILGAVLHFMDAQAARQVTGGYRRLVAPGSALIISAARYDDEVLAKQLADEYTAATFVNHSAADIASFFDGWELAGPGITEAREWMTEPLPAGRTGHVLAGVARLPVTQSGRRRA
jgi:O-methyltransferase involved in polyketide biosynthesis